MNATILKLVATLVLSFLGTGWAMATEHRACRELDHDHFHYDAGTLEQIAESCESHVMARLNINRARHRKLETDSSSLARLDRLRGEAEDVHMISYRMFVGLIETFATTSAEASDSVGSLIQGYEVANEIARLRIEGNDSRARYLERRLYR